MSEIPKVMHHIWIGTRPFPRLARIYREGWERLHPGWEMHLWTDENRPQLVNETLYRNCTGHVGPQGDILRYELIHRFGGVYVDADFEPRKAIDPLLEGTRAWASCERTNYPQWPLHPNFGIGGAVPGHPFFERLVENLPARLRAYGPERPAYSTGPGYFRESLEEWRWERGEGSEDDVHLYPSEYFYPYTGLEPERRNEAFPEAYAVHHWWASWMREPPE